MLFNDVVAKEFSASLLEIQAVKLQPNNPFTWASGWKSPIYCDNRLTLSYPALREFIKNNLAACIRQNYTDVDSIAGVATAGIPHGVLVAEVLQKPFIYVRSEAKKHGMANQVEGKLQSGDKVMVVEDLISTGMSSLRAVDALRNAGAHIIGLVALFTYGFAEAENAFQESGYKYHTLSDYASLLTTALEKKVINASDESVLLDWSKNPATWGR
jgi:orotate phosphoribosyltransferase